MASDGFIDKLSFFNWMGGVGRAILGRSQKFNFNRNFQPVNQKVILIDVGITQLMNVAVNVPHLNVVISRGAEMFSNMEIIHLDKNGKPVENSPVLKFLSKPNPLQNQESFLYDFYINNAIYASNFGYKNKSSVMPLPSVIWWLPPGYVKINLTGKLYRQFKIDEIIESYELMFYNDSFEPAEILHIAEGIGQTIINPTSKIEVLQIPLSNIMAALKSNNIILTERGLIGIISNDKPNNDGDGAIPMSDKERERIENTYQQDRSLDSKRSHVMVTTSSLKWQPMTFDVGQLKLYEGLEDSFGLICGEYGIDRDVFPSVKGATYENKLQAVKSTYQNALQPLGNKLLNYIASDFGLTDHGEKLICSYAHVPAMQDDKVREGQARNLLINGLSIALRDGVINHKTYADQAELPMTGDGVIVQQTTKSISNENT